MGIAPARKVLHDIDELKNTLIVMRVLIVEEVRFVDTVPHL